MTADPPGSVIEAIQRGTCATRLSFLIFKDLETQQEEQWKPCFMTYASAFAG
jgi:hypothetical protein